MKMSIKSKIIIACLLLIQVAVFSWVFNDHKVEEAKFRVLFEDYLANPSEVDSIDLNGLGIDKLISDMTIFENLTYINLSNNKFKKIPEVLFDLPRLEVLKMRNNLLKKGRWKKHNNLRHIDLSFNKIFSIDDIRLFNNIEMINLSNNDFTKFPKIGKIENPQENVIDSLLFYNNKLDDFLDINRKITGNIINHLDLSYNDFYTVRKIGVIQDNVIGLNLSGNHIYEFPSKLFGEYSITKKLNLYECGISVYDFEVAESLTFLDFRKNVSVRSEALSFLSNIEALYLDEVIFSTDIYENDNLKILEINNLPYNNSDESNFNIPNLEVLITNQNTLQNNYSNLKFPNLKLIKLYGYSEEYDDVTNIKKAFPNVEIVSFKFD